MGYIVHRYKTKKLKAIVLLLSLTTYSKIEHRQRPRHQLSATCSIPMITPIAALDWLMFDS